MFIKTIIVFVALSCVLVQFGSATIRNPENDYYEIKEIQHSRLRRDDQAVAVPSQPAVASQFGIFDAAKYVFNQIVSLGKQIIAGLQLVPQVLRGLLTKAGDIFSSIRAWGLTISKALSLFTGLIPHPASRRAMEDGLNNLLMNNPNYTLPAQNTEVPEVRRSRDNEDTELKATSSSEETYLDEIESRILNMDNQNIDKQTTKLEEKSEQIDDDKPVQLRPARRTFVPSLRSLLKLPLLFGTHEGNSGPGFL